MNQKQFKKESQTKSKPLLSEIDPEFLLEMGKVLEFGRKKYGHKNWRKSKTKDLFQIVGAVHRHLNAFERGQEQDNETSLSHLCHAAVNLMFLFRQTYVDGLRYNY